MRNRGREYAAGSVALDDPRLSPAYADLSGLPPLYLPVGELDTLREGVVALAVSARRAGIAVTLESWPGMVHGWQGLVSAGVPEALAWFERARRYLDGVSDAARLGVARCQSGSRAGCTESCARSASCSRMHPCEIAAPVVPMSESS